MANPNSSFTNIITTTWDNRSKQLADNLSTSNVVLAELSRKGRVKLFRGGHKIVEPLMHTGPTALWYSGADTLGTGDADVITAAEYTIKQLAANCTITGLEKAQNSGPEAHLDLLESKMQAAEAALANTLTAGIYSDGSGSSSKQLAGLDLICADAGTGTVGGIVSGTYTFWLNQYLSGTTTSQSNAQSQFNTMYAKCARGGDQPDVVLLGTTIWGFYMGSLQALARFVDSKTAALGFNAVQHLGANVYLDSTIPTATDGFWLNTKYLALRPHADYNMKALPSRASMNQDVENVFLVWYGALTTSNRSLQGKHVGA